MSSPSYRFWVRDPDAPIRVKPAHLVPLLRRFATMLAAGVNVAAALEFLASSEEHAPLRDALNQMVRCVMSGMTITNALNTPRLRQLFSPTMIGMLAVGEQTGNLTSVVDKLALMMEREDRLRRQTWAALTYPCALLVVILVVAAIFVVVLGARDQGLFAMFGNKLPWPTEVLISCATILRNPFALVAIPTVTLLVVTSLWRRMEANPKLRYHFHHAVLYIPVFGKLVSKVVSARMLFAIASALQVGVPMVRALDMAGRVCGNDFLKKRFGDAQRMFRDGVSMDEALMEMEVFPKMVTSMIRMGLESGNLDRILDRVSVTYEDDVSDTLNNATRMIEPMMLAFAGGLSGFLALATLLPIIEVVNKF